MASMLASDPDNSWFRTAKASAIMAVRPALPLAGASQLRFDRQDDGIEIGPLARSRLQRRGHLRLAQQDFDSIGRDVYPLDNFADEAFHLDGRRGEPSL